MKPILLYLFSRRNRKKKQSTSGLHGLLPSFAFSLEAVKQISALITELQLRKPQKRIHAVVSQKLADSSSAVGF